MRRKSTTTRLTYSARPLVVALIAATLVVGSATAAAAGERHTVSDEESCQESPFWGEGTPLRGIWHAGRRECQISYQTLPEPGGEFPVVIGDRDALVIAAGVELQLGFAIEVENYGKVTNLGILNVDRFGRWFDIGGTTKNKAHTRVRGVLSILDGARFTNFGTAVFLMSSQLYINTDNSGAMFINKCKAGFEADRSTQGGDPPVNAKCKAVS